MDILKMLSFVAIASICLAHASIDKEVGENEETINLLQKQIDSLQSKGESIDDLQKIMDRLIEKQNALLAKKAASNVENAGEIVADQQPSAVDSEIAKPDSELDTRIRKIVREELAKQIHPGDYNHSSEAKAKATEKAAASAPDLPEQKSEAMAQYEMALKQYSKGDYKLASSGFGRIIKSYPNDPITSKALVHLAFCLEKQNDLDKAVVVCEEAFKKKLDDVHRVDCQLIRLRHAKTQKNEKDTAEITKILKGLKLTEDQKKTFGEILAMK